MKNIGRYEVVGELAMGGMAEILLARVRGPNGFERPVAIKRILKNLARDAEFVSMFLDEAKVVSRIRHPNVVSIHELGREDGELFMVMDYEEGENAAALFRKRLETSDEISPVVAAYIAMEAAAGLHAAHESVDEEGQAVGLVHRDVSPQNLLLTYDGHVKVLDFGIALSASRKARTQAGQLKGKLAYMSPEQAKGRALDRRSDIFSLGIVLYELSTMRRLFDRDNELAALQAIEEPIVAPSRFVDDYPAALERIIMKALQAAPEDRYATAEEMRRELLLFLRHEGGVEARVLLEELMGASFGDRRKERLALLRSAGAAEEPRPAGATTASAQVIGTRHRFAIVVGLLIGMALALPFLVLRLFSERSEEAGPPPQASVASVLPTVSPSAPSSAITTSRSNAADDSELPTAELNAPVRGPSGPRSKGPKGGRAAPVRASASGPMPTVSSFHRFD